jgi:hypothetical protein
MENRAGWRWEYSRSQRKHFVRDGNFYDNKELVEIRTCTPWRTIPKPSDGHDLYIRGKFIAHGKTVKKLKERASNV